MRAWLWSVVQKDSERFALDPCTKWLAPTGAGVMGQIVAGSLHFWTQPRYYIIYIMFKYIFGYGSESQ